MKTIFFCLMLVALSVSADEPNPFKNVKFNNVGFHIPDGKVILIGTDGRVTWPKGTPSPETRLFCDAMVMEKSSVTIGSMTISQAVAVWNTNVVKLMSSGKLDGKTEEDAKAFWECLKTLFPQNFK